MEMFKTFKYDVCIVGGCGHVGFPLGLSFAQKEKRVVLYDINHEAVKKINNKEVPFKELDAVKILPDVIDNGYLTVTTNASVISESENVIMVTGTPVDEHLNPRVDMVMDVLSSILQYLSDEQLLILRSTLFPGTTEKVRNFLLANGRQTKVAFCPERIAQGYALHETSSLPQLISGFDELTYKKAKEFFNVLTEHIVELTPVEAEVAKLFTNTWRYINFAISNQFYMIASDMGMDFYKIYNAMTFNYPRMKGFAKAGFAAGPCLFKDTMQLAAFNHNNFFLGHSSMLVNEGLPNFLVDKLKSKFKLNMLTVGILGTAFKADCDDPRESLAYKLKKIVELEAKKTLCSDVYVKNKEFVTANELIAQSDIIIIGTPHQEYKSLNYLNKHVVDIWNHIGQGGKII